MSDEMKSCAFCTIEKPITEYYKCSSAKDGVQGYCKECFKTYAKARRKGVGHLQCGAAYDAALEDLKAQPIRSLEDMMVAMRRPKVIRMLKQIRISDLFEDLKKEVPAQALVPDGFDFSDWAAA